MHELTHVFEFDLIPQQHRPARDAAVGGRRAWPTYEARRLGRRSTSWQFAMRPSPSRSRRCRAPGLRRPLSGRFIVYNLGHAAFEFIEARFGKEGIRQFLYTFRKNIIGGGIDDIYMQAFRIKPEEFDEQFEKWLKERFKPFRDKQRPTDYGKRPLARTRRSTRFTQVFAFSPSPSGEMVAALTGNRSEGEADLVLLSTKDGSVIKNMTKGYTGNRSRGISINDEFVAGRSIDFDPKGDAVAFFARKGKRRSLYLVSVLDGRAS